MIRVFRLKSGDRLQRKDTYFQYSTREQFTGEYWIDGKKIYSKTYSVTVTSSTGTTKTYDITHNIANISTIWVDLNNSFLKRPNGDTIPLNYYDNSNNRFNCYFNNYDKKTFRMDMWGDFNRGGIVYITFRYTKTTD